MTPVASWSPADYYRATRAARRAWQATDQQLALGLEEVDVARAEGMVGCGVHLLEPAASPSSRSAGSHQYEGADASPSKETRRRQGGQV